MKDVKKVGILTLHRSDNYGAMLQAYALSKFLRELGYEPFIVNYRMEAASVGKYLSNPFAFLSKVVGKKVLSWSFIKSKLSSRQGKSREEKFSPIFEDFRSKHLNISEQIYNYEGLTSDPPEAYAFIVGSDQVWAADFVFSSPAFLLGFVPKNVKKIAYAASFGKAELERYLRSTFIDNVSEFDDIAVREKSGVDLVKNLLGRRAAHVVDPTLLLSEYSEIIDYSLVPKGDYILSYRLSQTEVLSQWMNLSLDAIASSLKLQHFVVSTNTPKGTLLSGEELMPTPGQLLGLIEKASLLVTNSFHGTVFALLLRTEFLTFARDSATDKQNLRLEELLGLLGLEDRYCGPELTKSIILEKTTRPCDFELANNTLAQKRMESAAFLKRSLEQN